MSDPTTAEPHQQARAKEAAPKVEVCEECVSALIDEPGAHEMEWDEAARMCRSLGADIADHICGAREEDLPCGCACRGPRMDLA